MKGQNTNGFRQVQIFLDLSTFFDNYETKSTAGLLAYKFSGWVQRIALFYWHNVSKSLLGSMPIRNVHFFRPEIKFGP